MAVEIEYEESDEYTSEEDPEEAALQRSAERSLESKELGGSVRMKKGKDPMAKFERRMKVSLQTQKIERRLLLASQRG